MVSKSQIKLINSLKQKKYRNLHNLFIAEGIKVIQEYLSAGFSLVHIYTTDDTVFKTNIENTTVIDHATLKKVSNLNSPNTALALFEKPAEKPINSNALIVALDDVNDPGNLGTIIRLCDWFGVHDLVCSTQTVDCYNPKVIQATMGSLSRVNITYTNLTDFLKTTKLPILGTFMEGNNVYQTKLPQEGILVMGNEANGICETISNLITEKISIPRFGDLQQTESLNVATATAILLSEFKRG